MTEPKTEHPVWLNSAKLRARWGGMSHTTLYRKVKAGLVPAPDYPFGPSTPYWRTVEIEAFEQSGHKQAGAPQVQAQIVENTPLARLAHLPEPNWGTLLDDLKQFGWSASRIADELGIPLSTLATMRVDGSQPRYSRGRMLVILWMGATGRGEADLPCEKE